MPAGEGEGGGVGGKLIQSAQSAKVRNVNFDEQALMKLKDSVRMDYGSFPWCGDGNPGYQSGHKGPLWCRKRGNQYMYTNRQTVQMKKDAEEARYPRVAKFKPFMITTHRYPDQGTGAQAPQLMGKGFEKPGDWRSKPNVRQAGSVSVSQQAMQLRTCGSPPTAESAPDPSSFLHNRRRQALVPETGQAEVTACCQWESSREGDHPLPQKWAPLCSARGMTRRGAFPGVANTGTAAASFTAPPTAGAASSLRCTSSRAKWELRPASVRAGRDRATSRWQQASQLA